MTGKHAPLVERFLQKIWVSECGCWLWTGALGNGYGRIGLGPRQTTINAHRVSYMLFVGEPPEGSEIDHLCHTRSCANPDHLQATTRKGNSWSHCRKVLCAKSLHAMTDQNTYVRPNGRRECRPCRDAYRGHYYLTKERVAV